MRKTTRLNAGKSCDNWQIMKNLFVFHSPLQYLLARTIADQCFPDSENIGLHYNAVNDFSDIFAAIDDLIALGSTMPRATWRTGDQSVDVGSFERLFLSNRFSAEENAIRHTIGRRADRLCAFEDGIALYLGHHYLNRGKGDAVSPDWAKNLLKRAMVAIGVLPAGFRGLYFPASAFDEVYSVFPDVPGLRQGVERHDIAQAFRRVCSMRQNGRRNACVVLSQSLVTDGLIGRKEYESFLLSRITDLLRQYDSVFYKRHPRDGFNLQDECIAMGCELLPESYATVPVELFLAANPGTDVYGFWSTSLIYAPLFDAAACSFGQSIATAQSATENLVRSWEIHAPLLARHGVDFR